jgi:hypothetical protein
MSKVATLDELQKRFHLSESTLDKWRMKMKKVVKITANHSSNVGVQAFSDNLIDGRT